MAGSDGMMWQEMSEDGFDKDVGKSGGEKPGLSHEQMWREYADAVSFKNSISLYETVRRNEAFYIGEQWEGVNAPDLDKPVFNLLRRVVTYFISSIVSDDIAVGVSGFGAAARRAEVMEMLGGQFAEVMEQCGAKALFREVIRNAAVDGDGCIHYFFEPGAKKPYLADAAYLEAFEGTPGQIEAEVLDNTAVCFGNPQLGEVQRQPWIIVAFRRRVEDVKAAAAAAGQNPDCVAADEDPGRVMSPAEVDKVTVLRRYWKDGGQVWFAECVAGGVTRPATATGYARYPLVWLPWEKVKSRYHGQAAITGMIPNQIFVNKLFAMAMQHVKMMAFPKVVYDRTKLPGGWSNQVGGAVGVAGSPTDAVMNGVQAPEMSGQVISMIEKVIAYTRDTMGATDAALGNIRPDNTSAIIAVQKASSMPLELQKMEFYRVVEESVRIWLDMMAENYGVRAVMMPGSGAASGVLAGESNGLAGGLAQAPDAGAVGPAGAGISGGAGGSASAAEDALTQFDFGSLKGLNLRLNVDIGAATYWSELVQVQTLDNLFERGIIPDAETYLEMVPAAYIRDKSLLLEAVRRQRAQMEELARLEALKGGGEGTVPDGSMQDGQAAVDEALAEDPPPPTPILDAILGGLAE